MNRNDQSFADQVDKKKKYPRYPSQNSPYNIQKNIYHKWYYNHWIDYIHLILGNCCEWCGRTAQQIKLEVDHTIPVLRFGKGNCPDDVIRDFLAGDELRILCSQYHLVRHFF